MSQEKEKKDSDKKIYPYDWTNVHEDLEKGNYAGSYGWDHACYYAIAEKKANVDLNKFYSKRTKDEFYIPHIKELLDDPRTQESWKHIVTFDPLGMTATIPTIAGTVALLNIPELQDINCDGVIVNNDKSINTTKAAVYYTWNIPALAQRLELGENEFRDALFKYTNDKRLKDPNVKAFLPPVGGLTCYMFGDIRKIRDPKTEIAVRVHDECNGSDVFGSDICTCRPYLMFALQGCVQCAQRGGVGIVIYFRKEGRSLGEVTKYRVYNARKNQQGGDQAATYFLQTENIAGIRDARFQTMMPDALNWLGIRRIDLLLSMSNEKYDAIISQGIQVTQRVPLPNFFVPKNAFVELTAKIMSGYRAEDAKDEEVIGQLRDLRSIRKQCQRIYDLGTQNKLGYWKLNLDKLDTTVDVVHDCILRHYPDLKIPFHSRFRHFSQEKLDKLLNDWKACFVTKEESVRRLIDLVTISVLLDAGAGDQWAYIDKDGVKLTRSEGLGAATFDMFCNGLFSSDPALKTRVNSLGLKNLSVHLLQVGFQVTSNNPMVGLEGRHGLLQRLGKALKKCPEFFGYEIFRPGHILDYVLQHVKDNKVSVHVLWKPIIEGLETIWPNRLAGVRRGDMWSHSALKIEGQLGSDLVPFHKLQQWLALSIMEALQYYGLEFYDLEDMTGLAEYRNGGLLIDTGVLEFKDALDAERYFDPGSELIVEWRALTVILIDHIAERLRKKMNMTEKELPLGKILEGGTWRAGRELAKKLHHGLPPIKIRSDGTVF